MQLVQSYEIVYIDLLRALFLEGRADAVTQRGCSSYSKIFVGLVHCIRIICCHLHWLKSVTQKLVCVNTMRSHVIKTWTTSIIKDMNILSLYKNIQQREKTRITK